MDFGQDQWQLRGLIMPLVFASAGICVDTNTDNLPYDATVHSQHAWAKMLRPIEGTRYVNIVGCRAKRLPMQGRYAVLNLLQKLFLYAMHSTVVALKQSSDEYSSEIGGIDTSRWLDRGSDGLLSVHTQDSPSFLFGDLRSKVAVHTFTDASEIQSICSNEAGRICWMTAYRDIQHLTLSFACPETWQFIADVCKSLHRIVPPTSKSSSKSLNKKASQVVCDHLGSSSRPDQQPVYFDVSNRPHHIKYRMALPMIVLVALHCGWLLYWNHWFGQENGGIVMSYPRVGTAATVSALVLFHAKWLFPDTLSSDFIEMCMASIRVIVVWFYPLGLHFHLYTLEAAYLILLPSVIFEHTVPFSKLLVGATGLAVCKFIDDASETGAGARIGTVSTHDDRGAAGNYLWYITLLLNLQLLLPKIAWKFVGYYERRQQLMSGGRFGSRTRTPYAALLPWIGSCAMNMCVFSYMMPLLVSLTASSQMHGMVEFWASLTQAPHYVACCLFVAAVSLIIFNKIQDLSDVMQYAVVKCKYGI